MTTLFLVRHGRSTANSAGVLAGRAEGVRLDDTGCDQARAAARRIEGVPLVAAYSSPIERCLQTSNLVLAGHELTAAPAPDLTECDYGEWTGGRLVDLVKHDLWKTVQRQPSAVEFPGGESLPQMYARAVDAIRSRERAVSAEFGENAAWLVVSHGDVIKSILADALGMHLDLFQRITVDPASISVVRYGPDNPRVITMNSVHGALAGTVPRAGGEDDEPGAAVGGGAGSQR